MTENTLTIPKDEPISRAVKIAWTFIAIIFSAIGALVLYEVYVHHFLLPFICSLALLSGLIFEYKAICQKWDRVLMTAAAAMACSWIAFFPMPAIGLENSLRIWPFVMCGIFGIATMWTYSNKTQIKLTEGITFMQCLALAYWVTDRFANSNLGLAAYSAIAVVLVCVAFSTFHAFTYSDLTNRTRLLLSLLSAFVMSFFASLNIYTVYHMQKESEDTGIIITLLQHFFLGVSGVYIVQNLYLIFGYLPSKEDWRGGKGYYVRQRSKLTKIHISRFSKEQILRKQVFICLLVCSTLYILNYTLDIVPPNLAIWISFLLVPLTLDIIEKKARTKSTDPISEKSPSH